MTDCPTVSYTLYDVKIMRAAHISAVLCKPHVSPDKCKAGIERDKTDFLQFLFDFCKEALDVAYISSNKVRVLDRVESNHASEFRPVFAL